MWSSRAGFLEKKRNRAHCWTFYDITPWALTGVTVVQLESGTEKCWLLATAADALDRVEKLGGRADYVDDPAEMIEARFRGAALLCKWPEHEE